MTTETQQKAAAPPATFDTQNGFSLISSHRLLALYSTMLKCRIHAERFRVLINKSKSSGGPSSILGHEAAAVGVAIDLLPEDIIAPARWAHSPFRTINSSVTVCATMRLATRAALANRDNKSNKIVIIFCNAKQASLPSWRKALNQAATHGLPVLFVSLHPLTPRPADLKRQTRVEDIPLKTKDYAFPSIAVDGNDVVAIYRVASEAIVRARKGHGPTLIVCRRWAAGDPLMNMEKYLIHKGLFNEQRKQQVAASLSRELDATLE